jgi:hypothetical protein
MCEIYLWNLENVFKRMQRIHPYILGIIVIFISIPVYLHLSVLESLLMRYSDERLMIIF